MSNNSGVKFDFQADNTGDLEDIEDYLDADFPLGLIDNLRDAGYANPSKLQLQIIKCMANKLSVVGNVPSNLDAHVAYISFAIADCYKAIEEKRYKPEEYKPYALFIVKDDDLMRKLYDLAKQLAKDLEVTTASLTSDQVSNEVSCEFAMQECDLVFLTANGFNHYVKDELIIFDKLKIVVVHDLCSSENDKMRIAQFKDMFAYHDFPKLGERIIIFFDDNYADVAGDILGKDKKGFILFDKNAAADGTEDHVDPVENRNAAAEESFAETEEALVHPVKPVKIEEDFIICASKAEKDAELLKFMETFREEYNRDIFACPSSIIFVKDHGTGQDVQNFVRLHKMNALLADGKRKRTDVQITLDHFRGGGVPILVLANLRRLQIPKFNNISTFVYYDAPDHEWSYINDSQIDDVGFEPRKIISFVGGNDYPIYKEIREIYKSRGKDAGKLTQVLDALKPLYDALPRSDDVGFPFYNDDEY